MCSLILYVSAAVGKLEALEETWWAPYAAAVIYADGAHIADDEGYCGQCLVQVSSTAEGGHDGHTSQDGRNHRLTSKPFLELSSLLTGLAKDQAHSS